MGDVDQSVVRRSRGGTRAARADGYAADDEDGAFAHMGPTRIRKKGRDTATGRNASSNGQSGQKELISRAMYEHPRQRRVTRGSRAPTMSAQVAQDGNRRTPHPQTRPKGAWAQDSRRIRESLALDDLSDDVADDTVAGNFVAAGRETMSEVKLHMREEGLSRMCLWQPETTTSPTHVVWVRLQHLLRRDETFLSIRKVEKVLQPDGRERFDIFLADKAVRKLVEAVRKGGRKWAWRISTWRSYWKRRPARHRYDPIRATVGGRQCVAIDVVCLNINGARHKVQDLEVLLSRRDMPALVLLQETLLSETRRSLTVAGYQTFTCTGGTGPATRGLATLVRKDLRGRIVGKADPNFLFVTVTGGNMERGCIVGNVYLPRSGQKRTANRLGRGVEQIREKDPSSNIIMGGDWNWTKPQVQAHMAEWETPFRTLPLRGSRTTRQDSLGRTIGSAPIDHVLVAADTAIAANFSTPLKEADISDHVPIRARIRLIRTQRREGQEAKQAPEYVLNLRPLLKPKQANRVQAAMTIKEIQRSNYWAPLADMAPDVEPNEGDNSRYEPFPLDLDSGEFSPEEYGDSPDEVSSVDTTHRVETTEEEASQVPGALLGALPPTPPVMSTDTGVVLRRAKPARRESEGKRKYTQTTDSREPAKIILKSWKRVAKGWTRENPSDTTGTEVNQAREKCARDLGWKWQDAVTEAALEQGLWKETKTRGKRRIPRNVFRAIQSRMRAFKALKSTMGDTQATAAEKVYRLQRWKALREQARRTKKRERKRRWLEVIARAGRDWTHDPGEFWKFAVRHGRWRARDSMPRVQPVKDPQTGRLVSETNEVLRVWKEHFQELADTAGTPDDVEGVQQRYELWGQRLMHVPQEEPLAGLNVNITHNEIKYSVMRMKRGKAPGPDDIPAELLRLAFKDTVAETPMARAMRAALNGIFVDCATAPKEWAWSYVIPIPKKGDMTEVENYRGISLMPTILKLLHAILARRIMTALDREGLLSKAQAGFRDLEECPIQAATLVEVARRRQIRHKRTYACFVDLRKAYDSVPHGALFSKLAKIGVQGRMLIYLWELYRKSTMTVRVAGSTSARFKLTRGLRQGCPLSPVLFNIFINDLLQDNEPNGVRIECDAERADKASPWRGPRMSGLLLADDLVLLSGSRARMRRSLQNVTEWCKRNEMQVGIHKCALLSLGEANSDRLRAEQYVQPFKLCGQEVPIMEEYTYLGLKITTDMCRVRMVEARLAQGQRTLSKMRPFLASAEVPVHLKLAVIRSALIPCLVYGSEVWGMDRAAATKMQRVLNDALRALLHGARSTTSVVSMWRECNIPPICAMANARRARAYLKCAGLQTWIYDMVHTRFRARQKTWATGTHYWLARHAPRLCEAAAEDGMEIPQDLDKRWEWKYVRPQLLAKWIKKVTWAREERNRTSQAGDRYVEAKYTPINTKFAATVPGAAAAFRELSRARTGALRLASWHARRKLLPAYLAHKCPCCGEQGVPETLEHAILECQRWTHLRQRWLHQEIARAEAIIPVVGGPFRRRLIVDLLLGGEYAGRRLKAWNCTQPEDPVPVAEADVESDSETGSQVTGEELDSEVDLSTSSADSSRAATVPEITSSGSYKVASFLREMVRARAPIIRTLRWTVTPAPEGSTRTSSQGSGYEQGSHGTNTSLGTAGDGTGLG